MSLKSHILTAGLLAAGALCSRAQAQATVTGNYTPNPNAKLTCPTNSPTWLEAAVNGSVIAACPNPSPANDPLDSRVRDLLINSPAVGEEVWTRIILPTSYASNPSAKFPVLYLLTGNGAGFQSWTCNTLVQNYLQNAQVIVVMPDGARRYDRCARAESIPSTQIPSWYSDWKSKSSDQRPQKWETFHLGELRAILEASFRANGKYAIAGLSMGGFGAIHYAIRNPGLFKAAASYSGMLDTISPEGFSATTGSLTQAGQDTNALWGYYPDTPGAQTFGSDWPLHNPKTRAAELVNVATHSLKIPLYISSGDGSLGKLVPNYNAAAGTIEAGAKSATTRFVNTLRTVANDNYAYPTGLTVNYYKGTHQWRYWDAAMCQSLPMLMSALGVAYTPGLPCNTL